MTGVDDDDDDDGIDEEGVGYWDGAGNDDDVEGIGRGAYGEGIAVFVFVVRGVDIDVAEDEGIFAGVGKPSKSITASNW